MGLLPTNSRSGPGGQEGPLPGPLPSTGAEAGRGTSVVQIAISCCRIVAEIREAELGGSKTGAEFSQPPPACIHTHTHTLSLSLSPSLSLQPHTHVPSTKSHTYHSHTHTHTLLLATYLHTFHKVTHIPHTQTHRHTPDIYTHAVTHRTLQSLQHRQPCSS